MSTSNPSTPQWAMLRRWTNWHGYSCAAPLPWSCLVGGSTTCCQDVRAGCSSPTSHFLGCSPSLRSALIDALWGDDQPADAGGALSALISKTRGVVGGDVLRGRTELTLTLPEPAHVDVEVALSMLHTAESAVAVGAWRRAWAPALSALFVARRTFLPEAETPWVEPWQRHLADVRVRALECYAEVCLELRGPELPGAERAARELVDGRPTQGVRTFASDARTRGEAAMWLRHSPRTNACESCCAMSWGLPPSEAVADAGCASSVTHHKVSPRFPRFPRPPQLCRRMLIFMTTTSRTTSDRIAIDDLAGIRGKIITRSDPGYDAARAVYNGAVDRYPLAIVRCADVADVIACVAYARDNVLPLAVRGGGHHGGGFGVWDDALVIDLSGLRSTSVDPAAGTVRVDAGCVWGDVDHATGAFGMALPSGFMSTTGVGGLTLGGGIGYLTRRFGLTVDNLVSADVVLADGRFVTASAESHSDLFWALRGGGGNFGWSRRSRSGAIRSGSRA